MPVVALQFQPGIVADKTAPASEGFWVDSDKVRFHLGDPEKIGGWRSYSRNLYLGECGDLHQWNSLTEDRYQGVMTNLKAYIESSGSLYDITPIRRTVTLGTDPLLPVGGGSSLVTVTDTGHAATTGDYITFSGTVSGSQITAVQFNKELQVVRVGDANTYTVDPGITVGGAGIAFGGAAVVATYQSNTGIDTQLLGSGWGSGPFGRGGWGSGYTTSALFRIWSQDNFGEELLILPNYGQIYVWQPVNGVSTRAIPISGLAGANKVPVSALLVGVTDERHVVCYGCNESDSATIDPLLIRWASQENYLDWEPRPDNTSGSQRLPVGSGVVAYCKSKGETLIWTDKGVHSMQFVGPPYTFGFSLISDGVSIVGPNAKANARNSIYWMDSQQFFMYNGAVLPLQCPVRERVFSDFNYTQRYKVWCGLNSGYNEVIWGYPSALSQVCDRYVTFNFLTGDWTIGTLTRSAWLDLSLDGKPVGAANGKLYQHEVGVDDDGSPMVAFIESGDTDIADGDAYMFVSRLLPDVKLSGGSLNYQIKGRDYPNENLRTKASVTVFPDTDKRDVRVRDRQIVLRIQSNDIGVEWRTGKTRLDMQPDGRK